ncbi:MAG: DUF1156 domain-containing protein [Candidatus Omnitrophica bacterium]|nr:DUF1156 domain-containing protein [Candidatus Omnitrophota bacterium]
MTTKQAIEESFPIVEINQLAVPERNAFKPIYQMHKWFARRASCVFRAILLSAMKPAGTDIMQEFYKDHTNDPDTNGKVILDPFMGGGTTVVEALRLGCKVIGIDLNPVAWFIVKTEVESVDIDKLKQAFKDLENRKTSSGKTAKEELLSHYKTECSCCGNKDADIIYTFWVKSAVCTNPLCKKEVPLFSSYIVAQKSPSIRFYKDVKCSLCTKTFDWEIEPASLIAESSLTINNPTDSCGLGRGNKRYSLSAKNNVKCPWCEKTQTPRLSATKKERKKVVLSVLCCPHCASIFQYRGTVPENVSCAVCKFEFNPHIGNIPDSGKFVCPSCGNKDQIIKSIRSLPDNQLLPTAPYAIEGYCPNCSGDIEEEIEEESLFGETIKKTTIKKDVTHLCQLTKNNGKFFKKVDSADIERYQRALKCWEKEKDNLPYPKQEVPRGEKTKSGLIAHHFIHWHQMFNPRQLLCLSILLKAIDEEPDWTLKEMLLSAFYQALRNQNMFCFYNPARSELEPLFSRHDFAPVNTHTENNVWGNIYGRGTFNSVIDKIIKGKEFALHPYDSGQDDDKHGSYRDPLRTDFNVQAYSTTSITLSDKYADFVITDPPYAGNVNYSELSDFFYVWLKCVLDKKYSYFSPEQTPKAEEIIENPTRGKSSSDFKEGLTKVFRECHRVLKDTGILAFTFHHAEGQTWDNVLAALCDSGFEIESVYPIHGDEFKAEAMGAMKISFDLIHICKKRFDTTLDKRSWAGVRQEIKKKAREEVKLVESGRYGNEPLSPPDIQIILTGKCLELYSAHYGNIVDYENNPVPLQQALKEIKAMVDQIISPEEYFSLQMEDIGLESYVWLRYLSWYKTEIKSDDVHKAVKGILDVQDLLDSSLIVKGRAKRGRTYEVKQPQQRLPEILEKFQDIPMPQTNLFGEVEAVKTKRKVYFADKIQLLLALIMNKENILPWLERFRGESPQIRVALQFIAKKSKELAPHAKKIIEIMDVGPLFK